LFMSIRSAASWPQPRQLSSGPRGARTVRALLVIALLVVALLVVALLMARS